MAELRIGRSWSDPEIASRLASIEDLPVNFRDDPAELTSQRGWNSYYSEAMIAREPPGEPVPGGPFRRAEVGVANYQFSDPAIVVAHFETGSRLLGRRMLLEMKAFRLVRYLAGVVVGAVRFEEQNGRYVFGYRYDTLLGHIERGAEWFLLTKDGVTGEITFRIEAGWLPGHFPNWWSRLGFRWVGPYYQRRWHQSAHHRLAGIAHAGMSAAPAIDSLGIAHAGPAVAFGRTPAARQVPEPRVHEEESTRTT